jgi:hypothetical protein
MQKLSGTSSGKNNKSCGIFYRESNKIGFSFIWSFYDFLRNLQESAKWLYYLRIIFAAGSLESFGILQICPGSRKTPWKLSIPCNVILGGGGRSRRLNSCELVAGLGQGRWGVWLGAHRRPVCGLDGWRTAAVRVVRGTARRRRALCSPRRPSSGAGGEQGGSGLTRKARGGRPFYRRSSPRLEPHGKGPGAYGLSTASQAEHAAVHPPRWLGARKPRGLRLRVAC